MNQTITSLSQQAEHTERKGTNALELFQGLATFFSPEMTGAFYRRLSNELKRTPQVSDLPEIRFLQESDDFYNLFFDDATEYMRLEEEIVRVEADNPLYNVNVFNDNVLFSYKLAGRKLLLDNAVNKSINNISALLDNKRAEGEDYSELGKEIKKSILSIAKDISKFFKDFDDEQKGWGYVICNSPKIHRGCESFYEEIAFNHYLAAQMFRYWLELNSLLGHNISNLQQEANRFYNEFLHMPPDTGIIDILPAEHHDKNLAKTQAPRTDYTFCINADKEVREAIIEEHTNKLLRYKLILPEDKGTIKVFFSGKKCTRQIPWLGSVATLAWYIKGIMDITIGNRRLVTLSEGAKNIWKDVVNNRFADKNGIPFNENRLKNANEPVPQRENGKIVRDLIQTFKEYI